MRSKGPREVLVHLVPALEQNGEPHAELRTPGGHWYWGGGESGECLPTGLRALQLLSVACINTLWSSP